MIFILKLTYNNLPQKIDTTSQFKGAVVVEFIESNLTVVRTTDNKIWLIGGGYDGRTIKEIEITGDITGGDVKEIYIHRDEYFLVLDNNGDVWSWGLDGTTDRAKRSFLSHGLSANVPRLPRKVTQFEDQQAGKVMYIKTYGTSSHPDRLFFYTSKGFVYRTQNGGNYIPVLVDNVLKEKLDSAGLKLRDHGRATSTTRLSLFISTDGDLYRYCQSHPSITNGMDKVVRIIPDELILNDFGKYVYKPNQNIKFERFVFHDSDKYVLAEDGSIYHLYDGSTNVVTRTTEQPKFREVKFKGNFIDWK